MSIVEKFGLFLVTTGVVLVLLWNVLAGGISHLPGLIALGGLVYWLVGLVLFRLLTLSVSELWQVIGCAAPVVLLLGWHIQFNTHDEVTLKYLIREGYRGRITIVYNHPDGITPATRGDTTILVIPPNGILLLDIPYKPTDYGTSSFYYMGIGDSTRRKIPKHYLNPYDSTSIQAIPAGTGTYLMGEKNYKINSDDIDVHDNSYWNRREKYNREESKKLFRLFYGEQPYRRRYEKN